MSSIPAAASSPRRTTRAGNPGGLGERQDAVTSVDLPTPMGPALQRFRRPLPRRAPFSAPPLPRRLHEPQGLPVSAASRGPGVRMPTRLSGSAPDSEISASAAGWRRPRAAGRPLRAARTARPEAGDEAAAADLAARLEPAVDAQQVAPRRQPVGLALEQAPEHDAVALQQRGARRARPPPARPAKPPGRPDGAPAPSGPHPPCRSTRRGGGGARRRRPALADGTSSARRPPKLSEVTRPSATSSASASSTWERSRPVPSTSSSKNEAPCARMSRRPPARAGSEMDRVRRRRQRSAQCAACGAPAR